MKVEDIHRKLEKKFILEVNRAKEKIEDIEETTVSISIHKDIIDEVIKNYNFKGRNFKVEYLPVILATAMEAAEDRNIDADKLVERCLAADITLF